MNKKLLVLAIAAFGVAGLSYCGGGEEGSEPSTDTSESEKAPEVKAKACFLKRPCGVVRDFLRASLRTAADPVHNRPLSYLHKNGERAKMLIVTEAGAIAIGGALVYKSGIFGWVRKNVIGRIPGFAVEDDEEAADAAA